MKIKEAVSYLGIKKQFPVVSYWLKLENVGLTFSSLNAMPEKIHPPKMISVSTLWWNLFNIFYTALKKHFVNG